MMILAKSNYSELIALAVFAVVAIISAVAKHAEKKNQAKQQLEAEERRHQRETSGKALPPPTTQLRQQKTHQQEQLAAARAAQAQPQASPKQPVRRYPPMPTPQRQPAPATPKPVAARRYPPIQPQPIQPQPVQPQPIQPQPIAQPIEAKKKPVPRQTTEQEITRLQSRLAKLESMRSKRLSMALPSETGTTAIESRLVSIRTPLRKESYQETTRVEVLSVVEINLTNRDAARDAIIMHEIFSPPKAMRHQPEAWEM